MNEFADTQNTGLLKNSYDDGVADALKRKRERLAATKLGLIKEDEGDDD